MAVPTIGQSIETYKRSPLAQEQGFALILAIAMLAILSILGAIALSTTDTELKVTSNYQDYRQTFFSAARAAEYATNREMLMGMAGSVNLVTADAGVHKERIDAGGGGVLQSGLVTDLGPSDLPAKMKTAYGSDFGANLYHVSVDSRSAAAAVGNQSEVRIDATIVRLFKNEDDTIFRTSGGG